MAYAPPALTARKLTEYQRDPLRFYEQAILEDGRSLLEAAEDWQIEHILKPLEELGPDGLPRYSLVYVGASKGTGKTSLGAAYLLKECILKPKARNYLLAADKDQATILKELAAGFVERNEGLAALCSIQKSEIIFHASDSRILVMSSDSPSSHGLGAVGSSFTFVLDEAWAQRDRSLFDAFFTAMGKRPGARGIVLTNAGPRRSGLAWELKEKCRLKQSPRFYFWEPPAGLRPGWITEEFLEDQKAILPAGVFNRFHEHRWGEGLGDVFSEEEVEAVFVDDLRPWAANLSEPVLALDLGLTHDRCALYALARDFGTGCIVILDRMVWSGSKADPVQIEEVERELLMMADRFGMAAAVGGRKAWGKIVCDPWQMKNTMQKLEKAGFAIKEWTFSGGNITRMSKVLFSVVRGRRLKSLPDPLLREELAGLVCEEKSYGWRLLAGDGHDDCAMAVSMGLAILEDEVLQSPFEFRGIMNCTPSNFSQFCAQGRTCGRSSCTSRMWQVARGWYVSGIGCKAGGDFLRHCGGSDPACPFWGECEVPEHWRGDPLAMLSHFIRVGKPFGDPPTLGAMWYSL